MSSLLSKGLATSFDNFILFKTKKAKKAKKSKEVGKKQKAFQVLFNKKKRKTGTYNYRKHVMLHDIRFSNVTLRSESDDSVHHYLFIVTIVSERSRERLTLHFRVLDNRGYCSVDGAT